MYYKLDFGKYKVFLAELSSYKVFENRLTRLHKRINYLESLLCWNSCQPEIGKPLKNKLGGEGGGYPSCMHQIFQALSLKVKWHLSLIDTTYL